MNLHILKNITLGLGFLAILFGAIYLIKDQYYCRYENGAKAGYDLGYAQAQKDNAALWDANREMLDNFVTAWEIKYQMAEEEECKKAKDAGSAPSESDRLQLRLFCNGRDNVAVKFNNKEKEWWDDSYEDAKPILLGRRALSKCLEESYNMLKNGKVHNEHPEFIAEQVNNYRNFFNCKQAGLGVIQPGLKYPYIIMTCDEYYKETKNF